MTISFVRFAGMVLAILVGLQISPVSAQTTTPPVLLKNDSLEATIQSGMLVKLMDRVTGQILLSTSPEECNMLQIAPSVVLDLRHCKVNQDAGSDSVTGRIQSPDGTRVNLHWELEPAKGDLVLQASAETPKPVDELRILFSGCDINAHKIVDVTNVGVGQEAKAPWDGEFLGNPRKDGLSLRFVQPLIFLFQGADSGWVVEGRNLEVGPANVMAHGLGQTAEIGFVQGMTAPTRTPKMYEIRIRSYHGHWEDGVDPYVDWMQNKLGFVPLEQQTPSWVKDIKVQANVLCGDYASLDILAKKLDPSKTFLGRNNGYRYFPVDVGYPDYRLTDEAKKWVKYATKLGFHVGVWFSTTGVDTDRFPELADRFRPGFEVTGHDANGKDQYWNVPGRFTYCSAAYKPWRDYLVQQLKDAVDAGVASVHLDESDTPTGKFLIDGTTAIEGVMLLEKQIKEAYPSLAIQTEEFNPMCSRYASFCFSEFDDNHPLGGYLFYHFIKFIPEGYIAAPLYPKYMDANENWGFFMPVTDGKWGQAWLPVAAAFEQYNLSASPRTKCNPGQLSAYTGDHGITAFFQKEPHQQGLVVYEPGQDPRWIGTFHTGITKWDGPGAIFNWPAYEGQTLIGLDSTKSYVFDESIQLPQDHFHITKVPSDFVMYTDPYLDIRPGEDSGHDVGPDGSFFRIKAIGHGDLAMYVPDDFLVFFNGNEVPVDRAAHTAHVQLNAPADKFGLLWAYRPTNTELAGPCVKLPWQVSPRQRDGHFVAKGDDFIAAVTATGLIIGQLPQAAHIHLTGSYSLLPGSVVDIGDNRGVIRVNGKEVSSSLIPGAKQPYPARNFDVDLSAYSGQHVVLEFICDGFPHSWVAAKWSNPVITVEH